MFGIICKAITVQQISLFPFRDFPPAPPSLIQLTHGLLLNINLLRGFSCRIGNRIDPQHPFFTRDNFSQPDFLKGKSIFVVGHPLFILGIVKKMKIFLQKDSAINFTELYCIYYSNCNIFNSKQKTGPYNAPVFYFFLYFDLIPAIICKNIGINVNNK